MFIFGTMEIASPSKSDNKIRVSRKHEILKEARRLFNEKGYGASSMRDIAQRVGIEAPSIYSHYSSKENILQDICFEMAEAFTDGLDRASNESNPKEQIIQAVREHVRVVFNNKEASAVMWNEWKHLTEPQYSQFQKMIRDYASRFESIIKAGIENDEFKEQKNEVVSNLILSSLNSLSNWVRNNNLSSQDLEGQIIDIYLNGILK